MEITDWFNLDYYIPSNDRGYWKLMISKRVSLQNYYLRTINSGKPLKSVRHRFNDLIRITEQQANNFNSDEAKRHRTLTNIFNEPARVMNTYDLRHLAKWINKSEEFKSDQYKFNEWNKSSLSRANNKNIDPDIENNNIDAYFIENNKMFELNQKELTEYKGWEDGLITEWKTPVMIDLNKDIKEIISQIKEIKERLSKKIEPIKDLDKLFSRWSRFGVLPYFDLKLWCKIERRRLTDQKIADLIFPVESFQNIADPRLRIHKTTKKYCLDAMTKNTVQKL